MIDGRLLTELWEFFKAHADKKQIDVMAEKYVDIMADYGVEDDVHLPYTVSTQTKTIMSLNCSYRPMGSLKD